MATELSPLASTPDAASSAGNQSWLDVQGMAALRAQAAQASPEVLKKVAQQFESLFMGMMLKSMRDAKLGDGIFDSDSTKFYQDMYDEQLSVTLSQGKGMGIASMLVKSLTPHAAHPQDPGAQAGPTGAGAGLHLPPRRAAITTAMDAVAAGISAADGSAPPTVGEAPAQNAAAPAQLAQSPEEFVALVMPHAVAAAASLGVSPLVLVAQAALETRWGQQVPTAGEGSSFNLFGIKADLNWSGKRVAKDTLEFAGGVAVRRREPFRAYDSLEHGFSDFVSFLKNNVRYASAIGSGKDSLRFADALQKAGYATDPAYSAKIGAILGSDTLRRAVGALKNLLPVPNP